MILDDAMGHFTTKPWDQTMGIFHGVTGGGFSWMCHGNDGCEIPTEFPKSRLCFFFGMDPCGILKKTPSKNKRYTIHISYIIHHISYTEISFSDQAIIVYPPYTSYMIHSGKHTKNELERSTIL